jgi:hypothetical protein
MVEGRLLPEAAFAGTADPEEAYGMCGTARNNAPCRRTMQFRVIKTALAPFTKS